MGDRVTLRPSVIRFERCLLSLLALAGVLSALATNAFAQASAERTLTAAHIQPGDRLILDGRLNEEAWHRDQPASGFVQQDPADGDPATEPTEVRVGCDDEHGLVLWRDLLRLRAEPASWGTRCSATSSILADDRFMVGDRHLSDGRARATTWRSIRRARMGDGLCSRQRHGGRSIVGRHLERARRAERDGVDRGDRDRLHPINFSPDATSWGINFQRTIRRKVEESLWSGWARNQGLDLHAGGRRLGGSRGLRQGLGLDLLPYNVGNSSAGARPRLAFLGRRPARSAATWSTT